MTDRSALVPEGYEPIVVPEAGAIEQIGPVYMKRDENNFAFGFIPDERHMNPGGAIFGGTLFSAVDMAFGHSLVVRTGNMCATVSMNSEFIANVPIGQWMDITVKHKSMSKRMAFVHGEMHCGDQLVFMASGVFRLFDTPVPHMVTDNG